MMKEEDKRRWPLANIDQAIVSVRSKLLKLKDYIDSDVRLKTELVGHFPGGEGETGTIAAMIREYSSVYLPMHESIVNTLDARRKQIQDLVAGNDLKAISVLEGITALQPANADELAERLTQLHRGIFPCPSPSRASVADSLRQGPRHECGLSFANAATHAETAAKLAAQAVELLEQAFQRKMAVLLSPAVRERLAQGKTEPAIAGLLACDNPDELRDYLVKAVQENPGVVDLINRYLKRIVVKRVRIADFRPAAGAIQKEQIGAVVAEFHEFLNAQFSEADAGDDSLPMIQLE